MKYKKGANFFLSMACLGVMGLGVLPSAMAADYPSRPVEVIIPFGPGSGTNTSARIFLNAMQRVSGKEFVPINVQGAGGTVGAARGAEAEPDGYQLTYNSIGSATFQPHMRKVPYGRDSWKPICLVTHGPMAVMTGPDSKFKTFEDLVEHASKNEVVVSGPPPGSLPHVAQAAVALEYGLKFRFLPTEGGGPAAKLVAGGQADLTVDNIGNGTIHGLRFLALLDDKRTNELPDVRTSAEIGRPLSLAVWYGFYAPADAPDDVVSWLSETCKEATSEKTFLEQMKKSRYYVRYMGAEDFKAFHDNEWTKNGELLKATIAKDK